MTDELIAEIQKFTLAARALLEREANEHLQGIYGWLPDGTFADAKSHPALAQIEEAHKIRRRLERFAEDEKAVGIPPKEARYKLVRETAFTWLNRVAAFRLMEERKLLRVTIRQLKQSNAFIYWLTASGNEENYKLREKGDLPLNAMGEGPADIAYRRFLLWQCGELARDVSVLFDPETPASGLCPRPLVLKELVEAMNAELLVPAWLQGNEETVGWIYQAFHAEELQAAFAGAREQGKKFEPEDIPAVTQLFTIRWVVRFLVENTLGRLWVEMHPDSRLKDSLGYLVPVQNPQQRALKPAREITFLDPCCGSMHFGLLAFDLFVEMYREELECADQPGWPDKPSVSSADDIAASIVANNIHGIDIDVRAVQLSALTLLLRARTLNPECAFTDQNLAAANVEEITGGRLEEFIKQAQFSHPIYERILRSLAARLKDSNNLGSLLRLEKDLERLVNEERRKAEADKQFALAFPGLNPEQFKTHEGLEEFFGILTEQVMRHLDEFVHASRTGGSDASHFVSEAAKGLRFMRLIEQRYDVVATNPPYLSARKMNKRLATLMAEQYDAGKQDLFAAFILRCQELLAPQGLLGMLTMHSYMFISSYGELRELLRGNVAIETLAQFGGGLFAVGNPGTLQTAAFVLKRELDQQRREEQIGIYFRLVKEPDANSKRRTFEAALSALRDGEAHSALFKYLQKDFDAIPGKPWVYWITRAIRNAFLKNQSLEQVAEPRVGLQTSDNFRFLRFWWEVGTGRIAFGCADTSECKRRPEKWYPYMKGGSFRKWFGNQNYVINYGNDGYELKAWADPLYGNSGWSRIIKSTEYYFMPGITYSKLGTGSFSARVMPVGFIFDVAGSAVFPKQMHEVLAFLNSSLCDFLLGTINPTLNIQSGDIRRLPIVISASDQLKQSVEDAISIQEAVDRLNERSFLFSGPAGLSSNSDKETKKLHELDTEIDAEIYQIYGIAEDERANIEKELALAPGGSETEEPERIEEDVAMESESTPQWSPESWLSYGVGIVLGRFEIGVQSGLGCGDFSAEIVVALRKLAATDGILVSDDGSTLDLTPRVFEALKFVLGDSGAREVIVTACGNGDLEERLRIWLDKQFWKYHFQLYRKRPVYWPLQSPKKKFTVWVFHERLTKDTLFGIRKIADDRLNLLERQIGDTRKEAAGGNRRAAKDLDKLLEFGDDLREFSNRLREIITRGYTPHIDDGVLINAAPLHPILPSWSETRKAWQELEKEEYEWSYQAMDHWPDRVKAKCKTDKSLAIAHGLA